MRLSLPGLWKHHDFMKLWSGQTISLFGSSITLLALPLTAVLLLHATAFQMGLLTAATNAPFLAVGPFAGVIVDRLKRRPILILADLGRAFFLLLIPLTVVFHVLRIEYLDMIALVVGTLTVFFDVAYYSYLPSLISRDQLIEGNSKFETSYSLAQVAGPGVAGWLIQLLAAPNAIFMDAISFVVSGVSLAAIRTPEPSPSQTRRQKIWVEISEGMRFVWQNAVLRALTVCSATHNFANSMLYTIFVLYLTRNLELQPVLIGTIFAVGSCGALVGALVGGRLAARFGVGPMIIGAQLLTVLASLFYPFAANPSIVVTTLLLAGGQAIWGLSRPIFNINQVSLRQTITPDHLLGRMTATSRFFSWGMLVFGGLAGGLLGEMIGLRAVLGLVVFVEMLATLGVLFSPVRAVGDPHLYLK